MNNQKEARNLRSHEAFWQFIIDQSEFLPDSLSSWISPGKSLTTLWKISNHSMENL